jgi:hypothetical protein
MGAVAEGHQAKSVPLTLRYESQVERGLYIAFEDAFTG